MIWIIQICYIFFYITLCKYWLIYSIKSSTYAIQRVTYMKKAVWWMMVVINSLLSSIRTFSTDKNLNSTRVILGFWADKTLTSYNQLFRLQSSSLSPNFGSWRVTVFFMWNEIFDGIGEIMLPTKAALIASLNLAIIHWSLSKNRA